MPSPTATLELPLQEVLGHGGALKSSWYGDCLPTRDFPLLQGRFDLGWELFGGAGLSGLVHVDQTPYCLNTDEWNLGFGTEEEARAFLEAFAADQRAGAKNLVRLCLTAEPEPTFLETWLRSCSRRRLRQPSPWSTTTSGAAGVT